MNNLTFIGLISILILSGCSGTDAPSKVETGKVEITATQFGDDWPLLSEKATIWCENPKKVLVKVDDKIYGVNGIALTDAPNVLEVAQSGGFDDPVIKKSVSPLIQFGLKLCNEN